MTDSFDKYCRLVAMSPPDTVSLVVDIIKVTPTQQPYSEGEAALPYQDV
jgi:hypothetical protein